VSFYINVSGGNFSIGTDSPSNKLTVEDTIGIKRSGVNAITTLQMAGSGLIVNGANGYHPLIVQANGTEIFRVKNDGNISGSATSTGSFGAIQSAGNITPKVDDSVDLGAADKRFKNIFTTDLQLSNEGKDKGNEVDGTTGSWTIQEGEEELYLLNRKNGKKYKFMLQEIK